MTPIRITRRSLLAGLAAAALPLGALAQNYPAKPVTIVVPFAPGGTTDILARIVGQGLGTELGQPFVVDNRAGAGGNIGASLAAKAPADGYTLFMGTVGTHAINQALYKKMPFDPVKDFAPISRVATVPNLLVAHPSQPYKTVKELIAYAKANPGKLSYGSAGNGASNHLSGELFAARAGIKMTHVPYKGNAPAMTDVMGGQINMMFDIVSTAKGYADAGKVLPVAVTSKARNKALPNLPSMQEAGVPNYDVGGWYALFVPNKTDPALIKKYADASNQVMNSPAMKAKLAELGYDEWHGTAKDVTERIKREDKLWGEVVKGIKIN
jgi:tripartite-type tricarboxylate transporter receptor subunit TctC